MWSSRFTEVISWKPQPHNPPSSQDWKHSNTSRWMVNDKAPHYMRYWGFYPQELCTGTYGSGRLPLYILLVGFTDPFFSLFLIRFFFFLFVFVLYFFHQASFDKLPETHQNSWLLSVLIHHRSLRIWLNASAELPGKSAGCAGGEVGQRVMRYNRKYEMKFKKKKKKARRNFYLLTILLSMSRVIERALSPRRGRRRWDVSWHSL